MLFRVLAPFVLIAAAFAVENPPAAQENAVARALLPRTSTGRLAGRHPSRCGCGHRGHHGDPPVQCPPPTDPDPLVTYNGTILVTEISTNASLGFIRAIPRGTVTGDYVVTPDPLAALQVTFTSRSHGSQLDIIL